MIFLLVLLLLGIPIIAESQPSIPGGLVAGRFYIVVTKSGTGGGTVTGTDINCGTDCNDHYAPGTIVTLTATPDAGSTFAGWSGACTGTGTCVVTVSTAKSVTASFNSASVLTGVTVNLGGVLGAVSYRASGFLHTMNTTLPTDAQLAPLKARFHRQSNSGANGYQIDSVYPRVLGSGAIVSLAMSDAWHNQATLKTEAGAGNYTNVNAIMLSQVTKYRDKPGGAWNIQHDIHNEPDHTNYWTGSGCTTGSTQQMADCRQNQFHPYWKNAHSLIRTARPAAIIVGPGTAGTGGWTVHAAWLKAFLQYCKPSANNCLPNVLAWHETGGSQTTMVSHVQEMRDYMALAANGIGTVLPIEISEYMGNTDKWRPAEAVTYFAAAERAVIVAAGKSIWSPDGLSNLDGLLTDNSVAPRSIYWAYVKYGEMTGNMMNVSTTQATIDGVASLDSTTGRALIGNFTSASVVFPINFTNIPAALIVDGRVRITTQAINNSEQAAVSALPAATTTDVTVSGTTATISPTIGAFGAVSLTVTAAPPLTVTNTIAWTDTNTSPQENGTEVWWCQGVGCDPSAGSLLITTGTNVTTHTHNNAPTGTIGYAVRAVFPATTFTTTKYLP